MFMFAAEAAPPNNAGGFILILIVVFIFVSRTKLKTFLMALLGFGIGIAAGTALGYGFGNSPELTGHVAAIMGVLFSALLTVGHSLRSRKPQKAKSATPQQ